MLSCAHLDLLNGKALPKVGNYLHSATSARARAGPRLGSVY